MPPSAMVECLTINPHQHSYQRHCSDNHYSKDSRRYSPRLPTPETSRSSDEAFEGSSSYESGLAIRDLLSRPSGGERNLSLGIPVGTAICRRETREMAAPHSPPYRTTDMQKPSLPPLKTVLGDTISSPPRTPSPRRSPMQPAPREPSYMVSTYKPPSLYPNKKQRTELPMHSAMSHPGAPVVSPLFPPSTTLEPRPYGSTMRPNVRFPPLSAPLDKIDGRRPSIQTLTAPNTAISPPWSSQYHTAQSSNTRSNYSAPVSGYQTSEQTPTSANPILDPTFPRGNTFGGPAPDPFAKEMRNDLVHPTDRSSHRSGSSSSYASYAAGTYAREPLREAHYQQGNRYTIPLRDSYTDRDSITYAGPEGQQFRSGYPQQGYHSSVPAFFMPSHYEYQHGKARKRSNLPKQSTEIMKTWFDQNISNPYPSEEQKAIFSNATGISMTQVSNWFINHRRRCPELRDKREKTRGGSRERES